MRRFFDFKCCSGHVHEHYVNSDVREVGCPTCGKTSVRLISKPRIALDGISGDFPGESMKWERQRAEKQAQERSRSYSDEE